METGIIVLKDVNQDSFNTINFSKNSHSPGLAEKVPLIKSDKNWKNDQTLFTIKEIPSKNLDPDDFKNSYDPYYNFYQTNKYLINVGCKILMKILEHTIHRIKDLPFVLVLNQD